MVGAIKLEYLPHYTYEDYKEWDGDWELIDGVPYAMAPSPMKRHQLLAYEIAYILRSQIEDCSECEVLGEIDYKISSDTIIRPDVVLTCNETSQKYLLKAPEIVVEVVSQSSAKLDEGYKFELYESEGVKYYILIYPDDLVAKVYRYRDLNFVLVGVFSDSEYHFENTTCKVGVDFKKLFYRCR